MESVGLFVFRELNTNYKSLQRKKKNVLQYESRYESLKLMSNIFLQDRPAAEVIALFECSMQKAFFPPSALLPSVVVYFSLLTLG